MSAAARYEEARAKHDALVTRYNREWRAGLWTTNRLLAAACEDAHDAMMRARREVEVNA